MRLFLGIDLPTEIKQELYSKLEPLRLKHPDFRWLPMDTYHLTLQFLGDVEDYKLIADRVKDILFNAKAFQLSSFKLDVLVDKHIFMYLTFLRQKRLEELVEVIKKDLGFEDTREFLAHISVSKSALSSKQQYFALRREMEFIKIDLEIPVEKIYLFESKPSEKNPLYNKVAEFELIKP